AAAVDAWVASWKPPPRVRTATAGTAARKNWVRARSILFISSPNPPFPACQRWTSRDQTRCSGPPLALLKPSDALLHRRMGAEEVAELDLAATEGVDDVLGCLTG